MAFFGLISNGTLSFEDVILPKSNIALQCGTPLLRKYLVRLSSNEEVDDQLRAVLAVSAMNRKQFNKVNFIT